MQLRLFSFTWRPNKSIKKSIRRSKRWEQKSSTQRSVWSRRRRPPVWAAAAAPPPAVSCYPSLPRSFVSNCWRSLLPGRWQDQIKRRTQDGWSQGEWEIGGQLQIFPPFSSFLFLSDRWCAREILFVLFPLLMLSCPPLCCRLNRDDGTTEAFYCRARKPSVSLHNKTNRISL